MNLKILSNLVLIDESDKLNEYKLSHKIFLAIFMIATIIFNLFYGYIFIKKSLISIITLSVIYTISFFVALNKSKSKDIRNLQNLITSYLIIYWVSFFMNLIIINIFKLS